MKYEFEYGEHKDHGCEGWRPLWIKDADPLGGMGAAHDILEHGRHDDGTISGEFIAFGRMIFTRGDGGYFQWSRPSNVNKRWSDNVESDFADQMR